MYLYVSIKCIKWIRYPWLIWRTLQQSNMAGRFSQRTKPPFSFRISRLAMFSPQPLNRLLELSRLRILWPFPMERLLGCKSMVLFEATYSPTPKWSIKIEIHRVILTDSLIHIFQGGFQVQTSSERHHFLSEPGSAAVAGWSRCARDVGPIFRRELASWKHKNLFFQRKQHFVLNITYLRTNSHVHAQS